MSWKAQRIAWTLMLMVSIAGLLGAFGRGPLSSAHLGDMTSPLAIDYERILRLQAPTEVSIYVARTGINPDSTATVWIDRNWLGEMEIISITPEPETTAASANRIVYTFRVDPSETPVKLRYKLEARSIGRVSGHIGIVNGPSYRFSQFAFP